MDMSQFKRADEVGSKIKKENEVQAEGIIRRAITQMEQGNGYGFIKQSEFNNHTVEDIVIKALTELGYHTSKQTSGGDPRGTLDDVKPGYNVRTPK